MSTFQNFIAGSFRETGPRQTIEVKNPANGRVFASVTSATEADVIEAVDAAAAAQKSWGRLPDGMTYGFGCAVVVDGQDRVYVTSRSESPCVAVFDRALTAEELAKLHTLARQGRDRVTT